MRRAPCEVRLLSCASLLACSAASIRLRPRPTGGAARRGVLIPGFALGAAAEGVAGLGVSGAFILEPL